MRAIIYARISRDKEGEQLGVARQIEDCKRLAERMGWVLHPDESLVDNDIGASDKSRKKRRPSFEAMIDGVMAGKFDGVIYYSNSRLTRRPKEYETIIDLVKETGVRLASCVSGHVDLTTADGRMVARVLAAQDAAEAERISERVSRAFEQRRAAGIPNAVNRAYGFDVGGLEVIPAEAAAINAMADMVLAGASLGEVGRVLASEGIMPLRAQAWSRATIKRVLTNPRIAGLVAHGDKVLGSAQEINKASAFRGVMSKEKFDRVGLVLAGRAELQPIRGVYSGPVHVLAGFMYCGRCGKPMKVNGLREDDGGMRKDAYVICSPSQHGCGRVKRNLRHLEEYVFGVIRGHLVNAPTVVSDDDALDEQEVAKRVTKIESLEARIAQVQAEFADPSSDMDPQDFVPTLRMLRTNLANERAALSELDSWEGPEITPDTLELWDGGDVEDRREILTDIRATIIIRPIGKVGPVAAKRMVPQTCDVNVWQ
jgi:DNA invertase Pin-like site-specific DNA recombinase